MKIGAFEVNHLNGGIVKMDGGAMFGPVPKPLWSSKYEGNDKNQVATPTNPILIQTGDQNILIDTGIGNGKLTEKQLRNYGVDYESHLEEELKRFDLTPEDIDLVLMTHLHFDHAAGLTDSEGNTVFTNATYYIQQDEWHEFQSPNIRTKSTYWSKNMGDYKNQVILFKDTIEPYPGIVMHHTGGHSYGHAMITIESEGDKAVHFADIFPTVAHINPLWVTAYDDYPMQSIEEKERLIPYYIHEDYWFLFYHDKDYFAVKFDPKDRKSITEAIKRDQ